MSATCSGSNDTQKPAKPDDTPFFKSVQELCASLRDVAIVAAVFQYFVGFVYLYDFFGAFGVSLFTNQIPPWYALTFSFMVIRANILVTIGFIIVVTVVTWLYLSFLTAEREGQHTVYRRIFAHTGAATFLGVCFYAGYLYAGSVADRDVNGVHVAAHLGVGTHLNIVPILEGSEAPSREFTGVLKSLNDAGDKGHALVVAESLDRIFIFVGAAWHGEFEERDLDGDMIYSLDKARLALREKKVCAGKPHC